MPEESFTVDTIIEILRREGLRLTMGRLGILNCLFHATTPLSLHEIQEQVGEHSGIRPNFATVFRTLSLMEDLHLAHRVNLQRTCSYFELNDPRKHYDHLVCKICGQIVLLDIPCPLERVHQDLEKQYGFSQITHSLEFFGLCPACV